MALILGGPPRSAGSTPEAQILSSANVQRGADDAVDPSCCRRLDSFRSTTGQQGIGHAAFPEAQVTVDDLAV